MSTLPLLQEVKNNLVLARKQLKLADTSQYIDAAMTATNLLIEQAEFGGSIEDWTSPTAPIKLSDVKSGDVLARLEDSATEFYRVISVRRKRKLLDVVDQNGNQSIRRICEFAQHWSRKDAEKFRLQWRY